MTVMRRNWARCCVLAALAVVLWPATGAAEVRLTTSVAKVVTTSALQGGAEQALLPADEVLPGEALRYAIRFTNHSDVRVDAGRIVITNPIPAGTSYLPGSAGGARARVEYSVDGTTFSAGAGAEDAVVALRWHYDADLGPGRSGEVHFHVRMQ